MRNQVICLIHQYYIGVRFLLKCKMSMTVAHDKTWENSEGEGVKKVFLCSLSGLSFFLIVHVQYDTCTEKSLSSDFFSYRMPVILSLKCGAVRCRLIHAEFPSSTNEVIQLNAGLRVSSQWLQWKACQRSILPFTVNGI